MSSEVIAESINSLKQLIFDVDNPKLSDLVSLRELINSESSFNLDLGHVRKGYCLLKHYGNESFFNDYVGSLREQGFCLIDKSIFFKKEFAFRTINGLARIYCLKQKQLMITYLLAPINSLKEILK